MNVIVTGLLDELGTLLGRTPKLVSLYEAGAVEFVPGLHDWLKSAETVLEKYRRPQVAEIAGLRAQLLSAAHDAFDLASLRIPAGGGARRRHRAVAALLLNKGQRMLGGVVEAFSAKRDEAAGFVRQMIMRALQKGTFYPVWNGTPVRSEAIVKVWRAFMADGDMLSASRHVLSLVNYADALRLVDEIATEWML